MSRRVQSGHQRPIWRNGNASATLDGLNPWVQDGSASAQQQGSFVARTKDDSRGFIDTWSEQVKDRHATFATPEKHVASSDALCSPRALSDSGDSMASSGVFTPRSPGASSASSITADSIQGSSSPVLSSISSEGPSLVDRATGRTEPRLSSNFQRPTTAVCQGKQNPRRTAPGSSWTRPTLIRQEQRRQHLVEQLVGEFDNDSVASEALVSNRDTFTADSATQLVAQVWPTSNAVAAFPNKVISLRFFIRETLRRSRTSYSTLQVTLWYLVLLRSFVVAARSDTGQHDTQFDEASDEPAKTDGPSCALQCGRRMFLAALILASKYLQDRNFTAKAWSKITGLSSKDIVKNETLFLAKISWNLHMTEKNFRYWNFIILRCTDSTRLGQNLSDTWTQVLNQVQQGNSLQKIAEDLSVQHKAIINKTNTEGCISPSMLLTPTSSFNSPSESLSNPDASMVPSAGVNASPASSDASDASAESDLSLREVSAPGQQFGQPIIRRTLSSNWTKQRPTQTLTPASSFGSESGDEVANFMNSKPTSLQMTQMPGGINDFNTLVESLGTQALVSNPDTGDLHSSMRALAQQQGVNPACLSRMSTPCGAFPQRSIAHESMRSTMQSCGSKRVAETTNNISDGHTNNPKLPCLYRSRVPQVPRFAC